jgi:hypothetical protein
MDKVQNPVIPSRLIIFKELTADRQGEAYWSHRYTRFKSSQVVGIVSTVSSVANSVQERVKWF